MEMIAPAGPVYQAGTLAGNPLAMAAGLATLRELQREVYEELEQKAARLEEGFRQNAEEAGIPHQINRVGSMITLFFTEKPVINYEGARSSDAKRFARYFRLMLEQGIFVPPSQFEGMFISAAHSMEDIERTIEANRNALKRL
jgi:glutamate-1-semialdehyde 2,1-aminomutase